MVLCLLLAGQVLGPAAQTTASVSYEAFAVRFGILPAFSVAGLVAGADRGRRLDIPVMVWLLKGCRVTIPPCSTGSSASVTASLKIK